MKKILSKIDYNYGILLLLAIFLSIPLFFTGYYFGHDSNFLIANISAVANTIDLGVGDFITSKVLPTIAWDFGYGTGIFYPRLAHELSAYLYALLEPLGFTLFGTVKLVSFITILLSGFFMYLYVKKVFKNNMVALLSASFYMTFPYLLSDIYIRDAKAESLLFIFIPIVMMGIYYLIHEPNTKKFFLWFVLGYVGLMQSHLICTVYMTILIAVYLLIHYKKIFTFEKLWKFSLATIIVILASLSFLTPMLFHRLFGDYAVFVDNHMSNWGGVAYNSVFIDDLVNALVGSNNIYFFIQIPVIALGYLFFKYVRKTVKDCIQNEVLKSIIVFTALSLWMSTFLFPWILMPDFLLMIQFAWRLQMFFAFGASILAALGILYFLPKFRKKIVIGAIALCMLFSIIIMASPKYENRTMESFDMRYMGMGWQQEYLPVKTYEDKGYMYHRSSDVLVLSGQAEITTIENKTPYLLFEVTESAEAVLVELPRLYYFGYRILLITENGETELSYTESEKGFISVSIPENGVVKVDYVGTTLFQIMDVISASTIVLFIAGMSIIMVVTKKRGEVNEEGKN